VQTAKKAANTPAYPGFIETLIMTLITLITTKHSAYLGLFRFPSPRFNLDGMLEYKV